MTFRQVAGAVVGVCGIAFLGYCVYFDKKRRSDPDFKKKLKERREQQKKKQKDDASSSFRAGFPDMKDQEAIQKFFLEEVNAGEELLAAGDYENCVKHLTKAIAVCGQPQQLLQVFQQTLPPHVFQMLIQNLAKLGSPAQSSQKPADDNEGLD